MIPEKGALSAIRVAKKLKKHIQLAGSIPESQDEASYWYNKVKPSLNHGAKYLGLIPYNKMYTLYSRAKALLVPITWNEAFGLVMIEAMACGTPVIAFKHGSVPEVIKDKKTGFIVKNESQMIKAVKKIYDMPQNEYMQMRRNCRKHVEENFSVERMVNDYEKLYYKIVKSNR
jgi:glycosyltransferase involved in cell wall biosynthesis